MAWNSGSIWIEVGRGRGNGTTISVSMRPGRGDKQQNPIAKKGRFGDRVGDEYDGASLLQPDALQFEIELIARDGVERTERLVHQQDVRIVGQRARDRGTLPHAAGKLTRPGRLKTANADELA